MSSHKACTWERCDLLCYLKNGNPGLCPHRYSPARAVALEPLTLALFDQCVRDGCDPTCHACDRNLLVGEVIAFAPIYQRGDTTIDLMVCRACVLAVKTKSQRLIPYDEALMCAREAGIAEAEPVFTSLVKLSRSAARIAELERGLRHVSNAARFGGHGGGGRARGAIRRNGEQVRRAGTDASVGARAAIRRRGPC